jgi:hypothetical protein
MKKSGDVESIHQGRDDQYVGSHIKDDARNYWHLQAININPPPKTLMHPSECMEPVATREMTNSMTLTPFAILIIFGDQPYLHPMIPFK